jgi:hypothetical protein
MFVELFVTLVIPLTLDLFMPVPDDNPLTGERIELGRTLFLDRRLSRACGYDQLPTACSRLPKKLSASSRFALFEVANATVARLVWRPGDAAPPTRSPRSR